MARILMLGGCAQSPLENRRGLLRRLLQEDHRVVVVRQDELGNSARSGELQQLRCEQVVGNRGGMDPRRDREKIRRLRRHFVRYSPEVFIGEGIRATVEGLLAAWLAGVSVRWGVIMAPGTAPGDRATISRLLTQKIASMLYSLGDRHADLEADESILYCARRLVGSADEIAVIEGSGIELDEFRPVPLPEKTSFLFDARLLKSRGVVEYVEAAYRIHSHHPSVEFRLAGWPAKGPGAIDGARLRSWIEGDVIDYLGHLDDRRSAIADSSVHIAPIHDGGLSRSLLQAMAMGRPIVTTDVPGGREAVDGGSNGFVVEPGDVDSLARAMTHFVGEPELRKSMGVNSRELAVSRFDVGGVVDAIFESLELGKTRVSKPLLPTDVP